MKTALLRPALLLMALGMGILAGPATLAQTSAGTKSVSMTRSMLVFSKFEHDLTEAALDRNIEVGLLVRDAALAASVSSHFRGLIDRSVLRPLPIE